MILVPTSDHPFYIWQSLVQMVSMEDLGLIDETRWLFYTARMSDRLRKIVDSGIAQCVVLQDWPRDKTYNPAMKPWQVGRWLNANKDYVDDNILVVDPDVILTRKPTLVPQRGVLHGTDTNSYTGPQYLKSKNAFDSLCAITGADPKEAEKYSGIGAQVAFTGMSGDWWEDIAKLSIFAYKELKKIPSPDGNPVQAWCAEMYVTQFVAIRDGIEPRTEPSMSMVWADGPVSSWDTCGFFHDAGQTKENPDHFCKLTHQVSPWGKNLAVSSNSASSKYVNLIQGTAARYPSLVWYN